MLDSKNNYLCSFSKQPKLKPSLGMTTKWTKLKHDNEFVNKLINLHAQFNYEPFPSRLPSILYKGRYQLSYNTLELIMDYVSL